MDRLPRGVELRCSAALEQRYHGLSFRFSVWWSLPTVAIKIRGPLELLVLHKFVLEHHRPLIGGCALGGKIPGIDRALKRSHRWQLELCPFGDYNRRLVAELCTDAPELQDVLRRGHARIHGGNGIAQVVAIPRASSVGNKAAMNGPGREVRKLVWHLEGKLMSPNWVTRDEVDEAGS